MPYKERETEKLYYSIGEVAKMLNRSASQIRFWEKEFDIIRPHKNKKGNRLFTIQDIEAIKKVSLLVKEKGFTIEGAKQAITKNTGSEIISREHAIAYLQVIKEKII